MACDDDNFLLRPDKIRDPSCEDLANAARVASAPVTTSFTGWVQQASAGLEAIRPA